MFTHIRNTAKLHHRRWHWRRAGVLFVHVPKAAGTSISTALYGRFLGHYRLEEVRSFDPRLIETLPTFSVARNPWDRCLSAYRFSKRPEIADGKTPSLNIDVRRELQHFETFDSFLYDWLRGKDVNALDYVFQEQSFFMCNSENEMELEFIGKVERIHEVETWLSDTTGRDIKIGALNKSGNAIDYRSHYNADTRKLVKQIYARDINNFGYEF